MSTDYTVLKARPGVDEGLGIFETVRQVAASSSEQAIRQVADEEGGTYIAVPSRSFRPVTVTVETQRRVRLADA